MRKLTNLLTVALAAMAGAAGAASAAEEPWEQLLRLQLEDSYKCVLSGTLYVRELPVDGATAYSGRAKCFDGREFDFSQDKPHMKFQIRACEPTVC
jgi:hypothetical protein